MCQRKWSQYNASLVQRGSLTIFCDPKMLRSIHKAKARTKTLGRTGRPPYPPQLLLVLLLLKIAHSLEGMACSLFRPHNIRVPCYTTLCRGVRRLRNILPKLSKRRPKVYLVDASGFKVKGEGEWKTKVHGVTYRRHWVKVHLLVDSKTNEIFDVLVTSSSTSDIEGGTRLLRHLPTRGAQLLGDGAYDSIKLRREARCRGIQVVTPPPQNAVLSEDPINRDRNDSIRIIKVLGGDALARSLWGKLTGYCHRVKVESAFSRLKRLFGAVLFSRLKESQAIEIHVKALLSNVWLNWNQGSVLRHTLTPISKWSRGHLVEIIKQFLYYNSFASRVGGISVLNPLTYQNREPVSWKRNTAILGYSGASIGVCLIANRFVWRWCPDRQLASTLAVQTVTGFLLDRMVSNIPSLPESNSKDQLVKKIFLLYGPLVLRPLLTLFVLHLLGQPNMGFFTTLKLNTYRKLLGAASLIWTPAALCLFGIRRGWISPSVVKEGHYRTLGVKKEATKTELRRAYDSKALECQLDKETMQELNHAKEVLLNPELRANYDKYGVAKASLLGAYQESTRLRAASDYSSLICLYVNSWDLCVNAWDMVRQQLAWYGRGVTLTITSTDSRSRRLNKRPRKLD